MSESLQQGSRLNDTAEPQKFTDNDMIKIAGKGVIDPEYLPRKTNNQVQGPNDEHSQFLINQYFGLYAHSLLREFFP